MYEKLVDYIQYSLKEKPLAYQLGFLQAHLAKLMLKDSKLIDEFKAKIQQVDRLKNPRPKR